LRSEDGESLEERVRRLEALSQQNISALPASLLSDIKSGENPVRAIRRHRLLTQRELSDLTGLGTNHISSIENGATFTIRTAKKLAQALEVRIDDIS
jgi:DNA-binding XRE family transcriptional regulator